MIKEVFIIFNNITELEIEFVEFQKRELKN